MQSTDSHPYLKPMMRIGACVMLCATVAVFMPTQWMAFFHRNLGLGELPEAPIVAYLSRSISAMYAVHGGLLWVVSSDIPRYRMIINYLGGSTVLLGLILLGIDLHAGLPAYWTWSEGPLVMAIGATLLRCNRPSRAAKR